MTTPDRDPLAMGMADIAGEPPPPDLEDRIVRRLRQDGLLTTRRTVAGRGVPAWLALAAGLGGILLGLALRPYLDTTASDPGEGAVFAMIFSGGPQSGEGLTRSVLASRDWARSVAADRLVGARRLLPEGRILVDPQTAVEITPPGPDDFTPTGFFLLRARDLDEAVALARTNPHLSLGGHLTVRPVDDLAWLTGQGETAATSPAPPSSL